MLYQIRTYPKNHGIVIFELFPESLDALTPRTFGARVLELAAEIQTKSTLSDPWSVDPLWTNNFIGWVTMRIGLHDKKKDRAKERLLTLCEGIAERNGFSRKPSRNATAEPRRKAVKSKK